MKAATARCRNEAVMMAVFAAVVLTMPFWLAPFGAGYPDLLQRFAIYGIFAIGFNILFGLTGYLSFGHAAFLGVGSYAAVWSFKLLTMNVLPAIVFAVAAGRRLGAGHRLCQPAPLGHLLLDPDARLRADVLQPRLFGAHADHQRRDRPARRARRSRTARRAVRLAARRRACRRRSSSASSSTGYGGFYFCAVVLIIAFFIAMQDLPLALRHDAAGASSRTRPGMDYHRLQHAALRARRLRHLRHVCRARRLAARGHRPAGRAPSACSGRPRARWC